MANNGVKNINVQLLEQSKEWLNSEKVKKWINAGGDRKRILDWLKKNLGTEKYFISEPFFFGVPEKFVNERDKPLIMVVGQETDLYGNIENIINTNGNIIEENIARSQNWVIQATKYINGAKDNCKWVNYNGKTQSIHIKSTPFFNLLKELSQSYNVCWNNLDKIHYTAQIIDWKEDIKNEENTIQKEEVVTLYFEDEEKLFKPDSGEQSLLEKEIDIVKPDIVLFVTGPNYKKSMEYQIGDKIFGKNKPDINDEVPIVENNANLGDKTIRYYWTYHPNYLRQEKKFEAVIKYFENLVN